MPRHRGVVRKSMERPADAIIMNSFTCRLCRSSVALATACEGWITNRMRTIAVDLGTRRVGLALSDEGGRFATPYEVVQVTSPEMAASKVLEVIEIGRASCRERV